MFYVKLNPDLILGQAKQYLQLAATHKQNAGALALLGYIYCLGSAPAYGEGSTTCYYHVERPGTTCFDFRYFLLVTFCRTIRECLLYGLFQPVIVFCI